MSATNESVLEVQGLGVDIRLRNGAVHAVDNVSLSVTAGETLGIVGESGCGKSTLGLALAGLLPENASARGSIRLGGRELVGMRERELQQLRGTEVGIVFQDPMTSLNPTKRIGALVGEALRVHQGASKAQARKAAAEMLELVGLPRPQEQMDRYPHELSGGMRQRVVIACALICQPKLLVADEPTTALDVTTQSQILELFDRLRSELGMAMLLVTHDMGVVARHADRVFVMYAGRGAEMAPTPALFEQPRHQYTSALLSSMLRMQTARGQHLYTIPGRPPDLTATINGCAFAPRCQAATEECTSHLPPIDQQGDHQWSCIHPADASAPTRNQPNRVAEVGREEHQ
jgi:peptide/nickel transport system ATP-binding protein